MADPPTWDVPFIEFCRPHGHKRDLLWPTSDRTLWAKADAIIASGFVFTLERVSDTVIIITITHEDVGDMVQLLTRNDRTMTDKITDMIKTFDIKMQLERVRRLRDGH